MKRGPIATLGGGVPLDPKEPIFVEIFQRAKKIAKGKPNIAIIPTASQDTEKTGKDYSILFRELGADVTILNPDVRDSANHKDLGDLAEKVDAFFFTGGNQLRITTMLGGTKLLEKIKMRYLSGAMVAGTSAGAACLTGIMIAHGDSEDALLAGELELSSGLNFIDNVVIDTHFTARGRFPRLIHVVAENPGILGIGIGEHTATFWDFKKYEFEVIGNRNLVVVDGITIGASNKADIKPGEPLCVENITLHILSNGSTYDLKDRKAVLPDRVITEPDVEI